MSRIEKVKEIMEIGENFHIGALRLLTPREHLRLMGFTDRDYNHMILSGIEAKQVSFLAGNSICIPVLEALYHSLEELDLLL